MIRGDFASIEAGLLGEELPENAASQSSNINLDHSADPDDASRLPYEGSDDVGEAAVPYEEIRSRRPLYVMAAMIVAGVAGIFASFAFKGAVSTQDDVATIKAAEGPVKVQPDGGVAAMPDDREPVDQIDRRIAIAPISVVVDIVAIDAHRQLVRRCGMAVANGIGRVVMPIMLEVLVGDGAGDRFRAANGR